MMSSCPEKSVEGFFVKTLNMSQELGRVPAVRPETVQVVLKRHRPLASVLDGNRTDSTSQSSERKPPLE